jgi:hypothetical protein
VFDDVGVVEVRDGRTMLVRRHRAATDGSVAHHVTGPALGLLIHQRRGLALHASGVAAGEQAVLFVGDSGWGKSTLAAACVLRGAAFVTDDIARVDVDADQASVAHGPPWLKMTEEAVDALGIDPSACEPIYEGAQKLRWAMPHRLGSRSLDAVYVLADGRRTSVVELGRREAFVELTRHSYAASVLEATVSQDWHARSVARLVRAVPVKRLAVPEGISRLDVVLEELTGLSV